MNEYNNMTMEDESPDDTYLTINDINTIHERCAGQLNIVLENGEEATTNNPTPSHKYNLRQRPAKWNRRYNMTQL